MQPNHYPVPFDVSLESLRVDRQERAFRPRVVADRPLLGGRPEVNVGLDSLPHAEDLVVLGRGAAEQAFSRLEQSGCLFGLVGWANMGIISVVRRKSI